jgi:dTDP-4-dehydrorhamnose 3,5-epimerase
MKFTQLPLSGAYLIELEKKGDERGFFARYFCAKEFGEMGLNTNWPQINNSFSSKAGTLRGLHFQLDPSSEVKLVRCVQGSMWDAIVDIRPQSPTFGQWYAHELTHDNRLMMYVPKGFAHGFQSMTDNCEIIYLVSEPYNPSLERNISWNDPNINLLWPSIPTEISERDRSAPSLQDIREILNFNQPARADSKS